MIPTTNGLGASAGAGAGRAYGGSSGSGALRRGLPWRYGVRGLQKQNSESGARALRKYACGATAM
eukprot:6212887-Pleurochrysis_carterae.AAC.3